MFLRLCISLRVSLWTVGGGGLWGMSTLVYINKLQARVRYTHITCRYLWINHPELLILRDVLTDPNAGKPLPSWAKTLRTSPSSLAALHQPTISLQIPQGTRRPKRAKNQVSSCVTLLIPPPPHPPPPSQKSGPDVQGGNLYKHCTFDLCVQSLTHALAH